MATCDTRPELTDRQRRMLDFIRSHIAGHGYPPSVREIGAELGIASLNGVLCHVKALVKKGYLTRAWNTSRSFRVVGDEPDLLSAVLAERDELLACCRMALESPGSMGPALRKRMTVAVERAGREDRR